MATAVAAALPLTISERDELRLKSITGYNEAQTAARQRGDTQWVGADRD